MRAEVGSALVAYNSVPLRVHVCACFWVRLWVEAVVSLLKSTCACACVLRFCSSLRARARACCGSSLPNGVLHTMASATIDHTASSIDKCIPSPRRA